LIDMDDHAVWKDHLRTFTPLLPENVSTQAVSYPNQDDLERCLDVIEKDARGYRFWHEVRMLRLITA